VSAISLIDDFNEALAQHRENVAALVAAQLAYEQARAQAVQTADGKNAEVRKAQADAMCWDEWQTLKRAEIEADESRHRRDFLIALARGGIAA
jgi:hypothetical protein